MKKCEQVNCVRYSEQFDNCCVLPKINTDFCMKTENDLYIPKKEQTASGIQLRDYFAAKAMQGMSAMDMSDENIAREAYNLADAMLKEREK